MTGETFKWANRGTQRKALKEKLYRLIEERAVLDNINTINENGFDSERFYELTEKIEYVQYELWCISGEWK